MALTLLEASKLNSGDVRLQAVVEMFARESEILRVLPFDDIMGNALRYNREGALPGIGFRGVNEAYSESVGVLNPITEALYIAGGDLDVDKFIVATMGGDQRSVQEGLKIKALAQAWTTKFIKGDTTTEPREFDGMQVRLTGNQKIAAGNTSGGDALSLAILDAGIDAVDAPTHILMSKAMRRRLTAAARTSTVAGYITYGVDEFGRRVTQYNGLPILVPYPNNGGTEPIAFDEVNPNGGSQVGTSIYILSVGAGRLTGIQNGGMAVTDLGELQTAPKFRTRIEWYAGLALFHGRACARIWGVKDAAVVA